MLKVRWILCLRGLARCSVLSLLIAPLVSVATPMPPDPRIETVSFLSTALGHAVSFTVVLPGGKTPADGCAVLMILHGLGRNQRTLLEDATSRALLMAQPYLIVLPDSGRGWWIDSSTSGAKYDSMLMEVREQVRERYPVAKDKGRWGVMGWSMGGFGALHFAERHPETVSFAGSIIGLLDYPKVEGLPEDQRFSVDAEVFGSDAEGWAKENPSLHVESLEGDKIVTVIAEQAFDRTMNENFLHQAAVAGIPVEVHRIDGTHVFPSVLKGLALVLPRAGAHFDAARRGSITLRKRRTSRG